MRLGLCRFIIIMLAVLSLSVSVDHLMELPARLAWDQYLWVGATAQGGFFGFAGPLGVLLQVATLIGLIVFAVWARRCGGTGIVFLVATALFGLGLLAWFLLVYPANVELASWANGPVPATWTETRSRWEWGQALNGIFQLAGFVALISSVSIFGCKKKNPSLLS
jgi:hypothetical protein